MFQDSFHLRTSGHENQLWKMYELEIKVFLISRNVTTAWRRSENKVLADSGLFT
jgi:hypothetical protein